MPSMMVSQLDLTLRIADYWVRPAPCQSVLCLRNQALCNPTHMVLPVRCSPNAAGRARAFVQDLNANSYRIENSDGHAWALVHLGETVTDTCCGKPCTHDWEPPTAEDVPSQFRCTRKHLCVHKNWKFKHATRILDVIMLQYPVKVRPMLGMWISLYLSQSSRGGV